MIRKSLSLFSRTGIIVGITLFVFQVSILISIIFFLLLPVVQNSAITMAAIIKMSAQNWIDLPPQKREQFTAELKTQYNFELFAYKHPEIDARSRPHEPYLFYLEEALGEQLNQYCRFYGDKNDSELYWLHFKYQNHRFDIAVPLHQLKGQPHAAMIAIFLSGLILTFISSWFLAYHLNKPINRLIAAVKQVSRGISPSPLQERGCRELVDLAESVNTMAKRVEELLENRTVMLAGISHDLRTPLTRMALSIEMLIEANDPELAQRIRQDIALMNEMIGHYMELASCLTEEKAEQYDLHELLQNSINAIQQHSSVHIELKTTYARHNTDATIWVYPVALKRIVNNLLENAIRYGEGKPVMVSCERVEQENKKQILIKITDHGPGIPEQEIDKVFRPFYRVDKSRSTKSGGSGLGLAIVSHLAQAHGWLIELKSPHDGGLTAQITLAVDE